MIRRLRNSLTYTPSRWTGYGAALIAVALVSVLIRTVQQGAPSANISMLYLIAVLATASASGSGPAVVAAVAAFLTFNWFFVEPLHTLTVADPDEWIALLLFLMTALVTGQLAAGQRQRAREAREREREAMVLSEVVRLMSEPDLDHAVRAVAERLRRELQVAAVVIEVGEDSNVTSKAVAGEAEAVELASSTAAAQFVAEPGAVGTQGGGVGRWIRIVPPQPARLIRRGEAGQVYIIPIKTPERQVGALRLVGLRNGRTFSAAEGRLLSALATQIGSAIERFRLRRQATEAEALRRTDELKTALLNAVSHALRTPLAAIIASAGSLRQKDVAWTEAEKREFAEATEQEAQRLNRIVGNLLDLSRIEAGSLQPEMGWYDLSSVVDDIVGRLRGLTGRHHVVVDVADDLPPVSLDYVEIDQVLSNLIENAAKYSPPGSEIRIGARRADGEVHVKVEDNGPGVPTGALPHLFEPFYRADGRSGRPKGTGVGLAVAKGLVEAHGGRIWADNRRDGGACFSFTLPLGAPSVKAPAGGEGTT